MKSNLSPLILGVIAWVSPILSFAVIQTTLPYSVAPAQAMPSGPDFSKVSLSAEQKEQLQSIQLEVRSQVGAILTASQKSQLETRLQQGQTLQQALESLNLSKAQESKIKGIMRSKMRKFARTLTPAQRRQLRSSGGRPPF